MRRVLTNPFTAAVAAAAEGVKVNVRAYGSKVASFTKRSVNFANPSTTYLRLSSSRNDLFIISKKRHTNLDHEIATENRQTDCGGLNSA